MIHRVVLLSIPLFICAMNGAAAQSVQRWPLPFPSHRVVYLNLDGDDRGVLVHGAADTTFATPPPPDDFEYRGIRFPFVLEADAGGIRRVYPLPDTARTTSFNYGQTTADMYTAAVRDAGDSIFVAWSSQPQRHNCTNISLRQPVLSVGRIEHGRFSLLMHYPGASEPKVFRGADGTVHLLWTHQTPVPVGRDPEYFDYSGEVIYSAWRAGAQIVAPRRIMPGLCAAASLDGAGRLHVFTMEYDSLPRPHGRLLHVSGSGTRWDQPRALAEIPTEAPQQYQPTKDVFPTIVACGAVTDGSARLVLQRSVPTLSVEVLRAYSSNGGSVLIDSVPGRRYSQSLCTLASAVDADGRIICAFAFRTPAFPPSRDTVLLVEVDAAMTVATSRVLASSPNTLSNICLLQPKFENTCLFYSENLSASLISGLGSGTQHSQPIIDSCSSILFGNISACDSTGAMWLAYQPRGTSAGNAPGWLLRLPPGTVAVDVPQNADRITPYCAPNPARNAATMYVTLEAEETVSVTVHDMLGREVSVAVRGRRVPAGPHAFTLPLVGLPAGMYFVRLSMESRTTTRPLVLR